MRVAGRGGRVRDPRAHATRTVFVPVAIGNNAVRGAIEAQAPRNLAGKREDPPSELLGQGRRRLERRPQPLAVVGRAQVLTVTTNIVGQLRLTGQVGNQISQIGDLIGGSVGRSVGSLAGKRFDQKLDVVLTATLRSRRSRS